MTVTSDVGLGRALESLGEYTASLTWEGLPGPVQDRALLVLYDTLGVAVAGAATGEVRRLVDAWQPGAGPAPLIGLDRSTGEEASCWINGCSACCLELDEGSKYVRGHPAAHVLPAALSLGAIDPTSGRAWLAAFVAGYEVAARFGRATRLRPGVHPHGTWGATGAAAAAGRLLGLGGPSIAGAIDAASALSLAPPFAAALRGSYVRNTWIGASGAAGLVAARLGAAGLVGVDALAGDTFGAILGTLDVDELTADLGERYEILGGYFKRHAACAYTHPVADAVLELRAAGLTDADPIQSIEVETYSAAATLDAGEWPTRLAAMFSIPYVVAETLQSGSFGPAATSAERRADATNRRLADAVSVRATAEFDERLPVERGARVTVVDRSGNRRGAEVRNPIGDADHQPLGWPEVGAKLAVLIGEPVASRLRRGVTELPASATIAPWVSSLTMPGDGA